MAAIAPTLPLGLRLRDTFERWWSSTRVRQAALIAGLVLFGALWGLAVAFSAFGAALLCLSFIACIACLRDFRVGVMLLIMIMPISTSTLFPHAMFGITGLQPLNLLLAATMGIFLMRALGTDMMKGFIPKHLVLLYILPLVAGGIIGMQHVHEIPTYFKSAGMIYFNTQFGYIRDMLLKPLTMVAYGLLVGAAVAYSKRPERFVTPMLISVFVMALMAIGFVILSGFSLAQLAGNLSRHYMSALGLHANDLGRLYAVAYALLLFVWDRTEHMPLKTALVLAMGTVTIALLLTFSRGAFLGFVIVNLIYLCSRRTLKTMILAGLIIPTGLLLAPGSFWYRLTTGIGEGWNAITAGRSDEIWAPLMPEILASPPWGNGIGSILWSDAIVYERIFWVAHPHNAYLEAWLDFGPIGATLLVSFWLYSLYRFWRLSKDERLSPDLRGFFEGSAAGLLSYLIAGVAGSSLVPLPVQSFLWLSLGVMYGVQRHLQRNAAAEAKLEKDRLDALKPQYERGIGALRPS